MQLIPCVDSAASTSKAASDITEAH